MVTKTPNLGLSKPAGTDLVDISQLNANADILDTQVADKLDKSGGTLTGPVTLAEGDGTGILIPQGGTINDTAGGTLIGLLGGNFQVGYKSYPTILRGSGIRAQAPLYINSGDGQGLLIPLNGNMNVEGTSNTVLGFLDNNFTIGHSAYGLNVRGSATRPQYNGSDLALKSDVSSVYRVMGSCTTADLASKTPVAGEVWNLTDAGQYGAVGTNVVWTGAEWDALGASIDTGNFQPKGDYLEVSAEDYVERDHTWFRNSLWAESISCVHLSTQGNFTSAWLQTTALTDLNKAPLRYPVLDPNGWIYSRTPDEMKADLGIGEGSPSSTITLTVAGWSGSGPYTQSASVAKVTKDNDVLLSVASSATAEASREAASQRVQCVAQDAGILKFKAEYKPTVNIPLVVKVL